jgi:nicotinate-nucleotide adenylyltransferase
MKKKTVGIFGGSFDPIHLGHINLALQLKEIHKLDEVIFFPAYCSPHKSKSQSKVDAKHRLQMVKLAIRGIKGFFVNPFEIKKKGISFTIDTVRMLKKDKKYATSHLKLLLSEDSLADFESWKEAEELLDLAPPIVGCRTKKPSEILLHIPKKFLQVFKKGITSTKIMEISSTEIRTRLKGGLYCGHLLPVKVLDYIHKNKLY